jgi:hypothetical protein
MCCARVFNCLRERQRVPQFDSITKKPKGGWSSLSFLARYGTSKESTARECLGQHGILCIKGAMNTWSCKVRTGRKVKQKLSPLRPLVGLTWKSLNDTVLETLTGNAGCATLSLRFWFFAAIT